jgi:hypothetical protein
MLRVFALPLLFLIASTIPAFAHGDQVIPLVVDGGGLIRTKIDITNPSANEIISRVKVFFYKSDGTPWNVMTNLGTSTEFLLYVGKKQTLRIETQGMSEGLISGYVIIRSYEWNPSESLDLRVSISVFYEVLDGPAVIDTVSVPMGQPTLHWMFPVEIDDLRGLYSGFAIVNLADSENTVNLQLWASYPPFITEATDAGSVQLSLDPQEQQSNFLHEKDYFPNDMSFKGILVGTAEKPVKILSLLQTLTPNGVQYSTLAAQYLDAFHSEGIVYVPDTHGLDADIPQVHHVNVDDNGSLDLEYRFISSTVRKFVPQNGAEFSILGIRTASEMNMLTLEDLQGLTYNEIWIDMSDVSGKLLKGFAFIIKTSLGHYAKVRLEKVVINGTSKDLALQIYIYR